MTKSQPLKGEICRKIAEEFSLPPNQLVVLDKFQRIRPTVTLIKPHTGVAKGYGAGCEVRFVILDGQAEIIYTNTRKFVDNSTDASVRVVAENTTRIELDFKEDFLWSGDGVEIEAVFALKKLIDRQGVKLTDWRFTQCANLALYMDCLLTPDDAARQKEAKTLRQKICTQIGIDYDGLMAALPKPK